MRTCLRLSRPAPPGMLCAQLRSKHAIFQQCHQNDLASKLQAIQAASAQRSAQASGAQRCKRTAIGASKLMSARKRRSAMQAAAAQASGASFKQAARLRPPSREATSPSARCGSPSRRRAPRWCLAPGRSCRRRRHPCPHRPPPPRSRGARCIRARASGRP